MDIYYDISDIVFKVTKSDAIPADFKDTANDKITKDFSCFEEYHFAWLQNQKEESSVQMMGTRFYVLMRAAKFRSAEVETTIKNTLINTVKYYLTDSNENIVFAIHLINHWGLHDQVNLVRAAENLVELKLHDYIHELIGKKSLLDEVEKQNVQTQFINELTKRNLENNAKICESMIG